MPEPLSAEDVQRRLSLLRVAKDVFLSDWYLRASDALVSAEGRAVLRRVAGESGKERDAALDLVEDWASRGRRGEDEEAGLRVAHAVMTRDFLDSLVAMKEASAEVLQKLAAIAPEDLRPRLFELANADLAHALALRQLLLDELRDPTDLFLGEKGAYPPESVASVAVLRGGPRA